MSTLSSTPSIAPSVIGSGVIRHDDLVETVAAALQYISYYHPADYIAHLARAYEREQGQIGRASCRERV